MKVTTGILPFALAILTAAIVSGIISRPRAWAQEDPTLDAKQRVFPEVGAAFRAVRRGPDGSYYVLAVPPPAVSPKGSKRSKAALAPPLPTVLVFDSKGTKLRQIPAQPRAGEIVSPGALDLDASGRVYIADQTANSVNVYTAAGALFAHFLVAEPTQIVTLPHDEFAVCRATADHLISVYDLQGKLVREFGELADLSDDAELNHRLNAGHLASDKAGNLYFAFRYLPEPTVRKYDSASGSLRDEVSLTTLDLQPMAQSARQEIARAASGKPVRPHEIISGFGVDPETQEFWLALGNLVMRFDNADNHAGSNRTYATGGARMAPTSILAEKDRLLLGNDPLGVYEFPRSSGNPHASE